MKTIILIVITLLFSQSSSGQSSQPAVGLVLKNINGRQLRVADYKGKVVILNFWATWCPPCRAEMPDLIEWQRKYRNRGLQVIGVTYPPNDVSAIKRFIGKIKVNYPIALGKKETRARFTKGETLPFSVVIDRNQDIRETIEGILLPEEFEQKIRPLLERPQSRLTKSNRDF